MGPQNNSTAKSSFVNVKSVRPSLTVGESSTLMTTRGCKYASNRKVQRMCREGAIDCQKITTTRDGNPLTEWLVNEASLLKHIEENEPKWDGGVQPVLSTQVGDATPTPLNLGGATKPTELRENVAVAPNAEALPNRSGVGNGASQHQEIGENSRDAIASPDVDGDAIGETRNLAGILMDNAKLTAELEGANKLIEAIIDDKDFLREELREARAGRKDVTAIAERMLQTLEAIAIGGRLTSPSQTPTAAMPHSAAPDGEREPPRQHGDNLADQNDPYRI